MNEVMQEALDNWVAGVVRAARKQRDEFRAREDQKMLETWSQAWKSGPAPETGRDDDASTAG